MFEDEPSDIFYEDAVPLSHDKRNTKSATRYAEPEEDQKVSDAELTKDSFPEVKPKVYDHFPWKTSITKSKQSFNVSLLEQLEEEEEPREDEPRKFKLKKDERDYFIESFKKMQELKLSKMSI